MSTHISFFAISLAAAAFSKSALCYPCLFYNELLLKIFSATSSQPSYILHCLLYSNFTNCEKIVLSRDSSN